MRRFRWYIILFIIAIAAICVWFFNKLILYVVLALVFSLIGRPIMKLFQKIKIGTWKLPDGVSAGVTMGILYGISALFFIFFVPILAEQIQNVSKVDVKKIVLSVERPLKPIKKIAVQYHFLERGQTFWDYSQDELAKTLSQFDVSIMLSGFVKFAGDLFIALFSVTFIMFFFLKDRNIVYNFAMNLTPPGYEEKVRNVLIHSKKLLSRYFIGVIIEQTIVGTAVGVGVWILGVDNALLIGFVAGLLNIIPYVGPLMGLSFALIMTIGAYMNVDFYNFTVPVLIKVFVWFNIVHLIDNALMQPMIYSSSVKAHPLEIFIVIIAAGILGGVLGLLLAIPVYTLIRVIAREFLGEFKIVQSITEDMYE